MSLFSARSKEAPLFVTWRPYDYPVPRHDVLKDPAVPPRIRRLDFSGNDKDHALAAPDTHQIQSRGNPTATSFQCLQT